MSDTEEQDGTVVLSRADAVRALDWYYGCELPTAPDAADHALAGRLRELAERPMSSEEIAAGTVDGIRPHRPMSVEQAELARRAAEQVSAVRSSARLGARSTVSLDGASDAERVGPSCSSCSPPSA